LRAVRLDREFEIVLEGSEGLFMQEGNKQAQIGQFIDFFRITFEEYIASPDEWGVVEPGWRSFFRWRMLCLASARVNYYFQRLDRGSD
jgi:hypothetical protein